MKKFYRMMKRHRAIVSATAMVLAVALIFWVVNTPAVVGAAATDRILPIYSVQTEEKVCALSFDAAWGNEDTQQLIDILGEYGVKATFFVVGDWVDKYPESVKALSDAGHDVMNHSNDHAHFSQLTTSQIVENVTECSQKIEAITGTAPILFRCPYGEYDDHVISALNGMGVYTVQWDVDSLDWKGISASEITNRVLSNVSPGSIVLFHNAAENTPEALPGIIQSLLDDGYTIVPVSEMIMRDNYEMDHTGKQCKIGTA
jgi:polysaccharide deacetylase family sporulation protein PdaB